MSSDSDQKRLEELNSRIKRAKASSDLSSKTVGNFDVAKSRHAIKIVRTGSDFVAVVVVFGGIGWYLDTQFATTPWLMLVFITVGFVTGFWMLVRLMLNKQPAIDDKE